jgi:putative methionine-R-sulfoxide reductase with GAF domain
MTSMSLLSIFSRYKFKTILLESREKVLIQKGSGPFYETPILFNGKEVGILNCDANKEEAAEMAELLAPLIYFENEVGSWDYVTELFTWVLGAKNLVPSVTDWIGIYYKANYFLGKKTTDLYLGPYLGEATEHMVIPLERGLCGLALREERVVNVANVHENAQHIACSLKTNSELIIPLKNETGELIAELDIDCHKLGAFSPEIERTFQEYALTFVPPKKIVE